MFSNLTEVARDSNGKMMVTLGKAAWFTVAKKFGVLVSAKIGFIIGDLQNLVQDGGST